MAVSERRARERTRRTAEILEAATAEFAERGLEGASMDGVAARAELGKATLYYYFPTKEALHAAVLEEGTRRFFVGLAALDAEAASLAEAVARLLDHHVRFLGENPALARVLAPHLVGMHRAAWGHPGAGAPLPEEHLAALDTIRALLARSPWAGSPHLFLAFLTDVFVALTHRFLAGPPEDVAAQARFYVDLVARACGSAQPPAEGSPR